MPASICHFSFGTVAPLLFAKGHFPSSSPIIKYCSGKSIWIQWSFHIATFVYHWLGNVTKHAFCIGFTPLRFPSQTAPGPERMAEPDSDSAQLSTNNKLSRWAPKAHNGIPGSGKYFFFSVSNMSQRLSVFVGFSCKYSFMNIFCWKKLHFPLVFLVFLVQW